MQNRIQNNIHLYKCRQILSFTLSKNSENVHYMWIFLIFFLTQTLSIMAEMIFQRETKRDPHSYVMPALRQAIQNGSSTEQKKNLFYQCYDVQMIGNVL